MKLYHLSDGYRNSFVFADTKEEAVTLFNVLQIDWPATLNSIEDEYEIEKGVVKIIYVPADNDY